MFNKIIFIVILCLLIGSGIIFADNYDDLIGSCMALASRMGMDEAEKKIFCDCLIKEGRSQAVSSAALKEAIDNVNNLAYVMTDEVKPAKKVLDGCFLKLNEGAMKRAQEIYRNKK